MSLSAKLSKLSASVTVHSLWSAQPKLRWLLEPVY